jgi:hypothetical protein
MKRVTISLTIASLAILAFVAVVSAAGPRSQAGAAVQSRTAVATILGLRQDEVADLRQEGQSLAQIAAARNVDPQRLEEALATQWTTRIEARVGNGALTSDQAEELRAQVAVRAKAMVEQVTTGGMRGAAVGAGPANGQRAGNGAGAGSGQGARGNGSCDGTGPNGNGRSGAPAS